MTDAEIREKVVSYRKVHQNFGIWQRLRTESADVKYVALYLSTGPMSAKRPTTTRQRPPWCHEWLPNRSGPS